jgi:hypothetical protein
MKKYVITFIIFITLFSGISYASAYVSDKTVGLGLMFGEPSGLSAKYWLSKNNAIDAGIGWAFIGRNGISMHADYLFQHFNFLSKNPKLFFYCGLGGSFGINEQNQKTLIKNNRVSSSSSTSRIGVRAPAGISYIFDSPFDIFFEIVPILDLVPGVSFGFDAAIGGRIYF